MLELLSNPCVSKARRFSYLVTGTAEHVKDQLLKEYRESHGAEMVAALQKLEVLTVQIIWVVVIITILRIMIKAQMMAAIQAKIKEVEKIAH